VRNWGFPQFRSAPSCLTVSWRHSPAVVREPWPHDAQTGRLSM